MIVFAVFFQEFFRVDKKHIMQCFVLSIEVFLFNLFVLLGSKGINATSIACVLSSYFIFVPICELIAFKQKPAISTIIAIIVVLIGVFFMMNCNLASLCNVNILFLIIADIFFAIYIVSVSKYASGSNPSILAMGQLFFNFIIALVCWVIESIFSHTPINIPHSPAFWGSVIFISFFIRAFYGVIQIYAQRFVTALNTSLIFSTEIIITMIASPFVSGYFGMEVPKDNISAYRVIGALVMVCGILVADPAVVGRFIKGKGKMKIDI